MLRKRKLISFIVLAHASVLSSAATAPSSEKSDAAVSADSVSHSSRTCGGAEAGSAFRGAPSQLSGTSVDIDPTITVHADYVEYFENNRLELEGNVEISREDYIARGDEAKIDQSANEASLTGNIEIVGPQMQMRSKSAEVNLVKGSATLHEAEFINPETGFRGKAELIDQADQMHLRIENGGFTTCEGPKPDWSFEASELEFNQEEGYGTAKHARFNILDVPVLYVPWFTFPIDDRRKSGFLYPTVGSSNTGDGLFIATPYYLNLAPNYDATITPSWIAGRGWHEEVEFRHMSQMQQSNLVFGYIDQDDAYLDNERAQGNLEEDGQRWGFSLSQDWNFEDLSENTFATVDYAQISDDDYLDDLDQGLQVASKDMLDRRFSLTKTGDSYRANALLQQYKSLSASTQPSEQAYQRLPELNFEAYKPIDNIDLDWTSQYVYFYRDNESLNLSGADKVYGSRFQHRPMLAYPTLSSWGYATPRVSLDHTDYYLEERVAGQKHVSRTIPVLEFDTGLYMDRKPNLLPENYTNSFEPRLYYVYSEYEDQDDLPNFDSSIPSFNYDNLFRANRFTGGDRVGDENRLTLSITSRWTDWSRSLDVLTLNFGHISQFARRKVSTPQSQRIVDGESLLASEVTVKPDHKWTVQFSNLWDASKDQTEESVSKLSYQPSNQSAVLNLAHRYRRDEIEQSDTSVIYPINPEVSVLGQWRYALDENRTVGSLAGLEYTSCCWRVQVLGQRYLTDDGDIDNGFLFRFQLRGLGGFGVSDAKMDSLIPGYQRREETIN
jgi:LPS-assembly protein